eukprot:4222193-Prymnesium_polylepis.1
MAPLLPPPLFLLLFCCALLLGWLCAFSWVGVRSWVLGVWVGPLRSPCSLRSLGAPLSIIVAPLAAYLNPHLHV